MLEYIQLFFMYLPMLKKSAHFFQDSYTKGSDFAVIKKEGAHRALSGVKKSAVSAMNAIKNKKCL